MQFPLEVAQHANSLLLADAKCKKQILYRLLIQVTSKGVMLGYGMAKINPKRYPVCIERFCR